MFVLNFGDRIDIQGRKLCKANFLENLFIICLHLYGYEPISFKLGMIIDTNKLYNLTPT